ncbi:FAD-dependent oxidoreductase [Arenimonas sp.]|uniref:flavin-containing monooxygenase n=1 Tax=Arenimonas sp. TaxID=1872635 RepID=UPI0025BD2C32|nr:FAD-dependent oxidoreductase [Arenimonas sp.]
MTAGAGNATREHVFPVIVVGAGPGGLAASRQLRHHGIEHLVLDQGDLGESWRNMPATLHLVSPWWTNVLSFRDVLRHWPFSMVSAADYATYLAAFARRHGIEVLGGCRVDAIDRPGGDGAPFVLATSKGQLHCRAVIIATGYFSNPVGPVPAPQHDGSIPVVHAASYPGTEAIARLCAGKPALIVGRRISAGQLMVELADSGLSVALSTRQPVEFRRDGLLGNAKDFIYYFYEELLMKFKPELRAPSFPVMDGGRSRQMVESGQVMAHPEITAVREGRVTFRDGSSLEPGVILLATGYRPALPALQSLPIRRLEDDLPACIRWQADGVPGLYFLGLDNRMNYRSRTIRGIRSDAAGIAAQLRRRPA